MKARFTFSLFLILVAVRGSAQDSTVYLNLRQAIDAAVSANPAIRLSKLDEQIAKARLRQTDAIFLPNINLSYSGLSTNNPLNAFGFKLQQKSITAADFNPDLLNDPSARADFSSKIEIQQPLVNMDLLYQRKGAAKQIEMYALLTQRTQEYLAFETEKAYLQLQMLYHADQVLKEALATATSFRKNSNDFFNQGMIQKSDLLNAELQVINIENQIQQSGSNIRDASDMLSLLMGQSGGMIYRVDSLLQMDPVVTEGLTVPNNRADFKALQKGMEGYDWMIKSSKMNFLPRLNAFASYQTNDKKAFGFNAQAYLVGVQLNWNLFNGNRTKHTITQQLAEKDKLARQLDQQKAESAMQLHHAQRQLENARFSMRQQKLAVEQASEALRVLQNRFSQGLVKTSDVLLAQNQLSQQKLGAIQAIYQYNLAAAQIQFLIHQ